MIIKDFLTNYKKIDRFLPREWNLRRQTKYQNQYMILIQ